MGSLSLLNGYGSSGEEEEEGENEIQSNIIQPSRLPRPEFSTVVAVKNIWQKPADDRSEHQGRIRSFPHEPGNWSTYVYIPVDLSESLKYYILNLKKHCNTLDLKIVENPHISLTRTVVLRHHWINDFTKSVQSNISDIPSFSLSLANPKIWTNEEKTRTFLGLEVTHGTNEADELVRILDSNLAEYKLPTFYENPSYHCSLLWSLGDISMELTQLTENLPRKLQHFRLSMDVNHCQCTTGNKTFKINLKSG